MQAARLHKQNMNCLSSQNMSFDFLRASFGFIMDLARNDYSLIAESEEKYYAGIRQPRCRNGG